MFDDALARSCGSSTDFEIGGIRLYHHRGPAVHLGQSRPHLILGLFADINLPYQKMIDDLQELSRSYVNENREAVRKGHQGKMVHSSR